MLRQYVEHLNDSRLLTWLPTNSVGRCGPPIRFEKGKLLVRSDFIGCHKFSVQDSYWRSGEIKIAGLALCVLSNLRLS